MANQELILNEDSLVTFTEWNGQQYVSPNEVEISDSTEFELPDGSAEVLPVTVGTLGSCVIELDVETDNIGLRMANGSTNIFYQLKKVSYNKIVSAHLS